MAWYNFTYSANNFIKIIQNYYNNWSQVLNVQLTGIKINQK